MNRFKFFLLTAVLSFLAFSCDGGNEAQKAECITALDCPEGFQCADGKCFDPNAGNDEDSAVLPDTGADDKDADSVHNDPDVIDSDSPHKDDDVIGTPDPDGADEDNVVATDSDVNDIDTVDADASDVDVTDIDSDTNDDDNFVPVCGNAVPEEGEECDLGVVLNTGAYGGCKVDCTLAIRCGDGTKNGPELCDAGVNNGSYGFCKADCSGAGERCGDGTKNGPEICDDGSNNGLYGYCNSFCTGFGLRCGDGAVNGPFGAEECDAGPDNGVVTKCTYGLLNCNVCDGSCKEQTGIPEYCGDSTKNGPESCDDGANNGTYGYCNSSCTGINKCGDLTVQSTEVCDGNTAVCSAIPGMGYNNAATVGCKGTCDAWITDECTCASGYEKDGTQKCTDTNECNDPILNTCDDNADCQNTSGSFNCTCRTNYSGNGLTCTPDTRVNQACTGLPSNAAWNTAASINQTWSGSAWLPSTTGTFNSVSSTTECRFVCNVNYSWNGSSCAPDTKANQSCTGLPANAVWNTAQVITQTWNGSAWEPSTAGSYNSAPSLTECRFMCDTNYSWSGSMCIADTRTSQSCTGLPANASWNTVSIISQTWNGSLWYPSTTGSYNAVSSNTECRFVCNQNYTWNGSVCVADTKANQNCTGLPANASWNTASSITQTWNGSDWAPSTAGTYNASSSNTECRFKCNTNYTWNNSSCVADIKTNQLCTGLPANASWNTVSVIDQTWNGTDWLPSTAGTYSASPSTAECRFKCNTNFSWSGSACIADIKYDQACTGLPSNAVWNTVSSINQTWSGSAWLPTTTGSYNETGSTSECRYKCAADYHWESGSCVSNTRTNQTCSAKPANTDWNTVSSITQTWSGSAWTPSTTSSYSETPSTANCYYKCSADYHWDGGSCVSNTRTNQSCTGLPANADWNTVSSIAQTWSGSDWTPSTAGTYNTVSSVTECRYQCKTNYNWSGAACVAATQTASCPAKPANTDWNDSGKNGTYTQTWNGTTWAPVNSTTYNATPGDCRYICSSGYHWETSSCVSNTRTDQACSAKPANTDWNTVSSITQTWSGGVWSPTTTSSYNETGSTAECRYKCSSGYHLDGGSCISDTRNGQACSAKPINSDWNTVSSITQNWNGSTWIPSTTSSYNEAGSTAECRFKCSSDFYWNSSACVECTDNTHCSDEPGKPYCYTINNTCAECLVDGNCSVGYICNLSKQCELNNPCGAGWTYNSLTGKCYKYVSTAATWTAARDACTGQSARLVDISDATENQYVASLMPDGTHIWTGLNDYPVAVSANGGNPTCGTPEAADGTKGSVFYGTTSNASSNIADTCNGSTEDQKEEYFRLIPSAGKNGDWRIKAYQSDSDSFDLAVIVDQNCMTGNNGCSDTAGNCTVESMTINLSNTTYYIYIDSDLHNGDYVIDIIPPASVLPAGIVRAFRWEGLYVSWNNTSFTNFLAGEPNFNSASTSSCDSTKGRYLTVRCVGEQKYSGAANGATWYDDDCTLTKPYVCEK